MPKKTPPLKIGETDCPGCGASVDLKVNSKGTVYFYCNKILPPDEQRRNAVERCFTRMLFGRTKSKELLNDFMAAQPSVQIPTPQPEPEEHDHATENVTEPAGTDTGSQPAPAPRKSFLAGILGEF